ncbi:DUF4444 domain-containing protein [Sulfitobacter sp. S223]|uniref:biotin/lipoate--protein ligase family protein n=1 Tax=Sulfitobacter sp. S223 TaxID=2867023 RepID=UPI0021A3DA34|nr:biotin/lipoate--protein ligase family protein [Sulfitobacter sp. S223]UWR25694.1 DUF4444 domain-containing protein [Sulfitobacter sp. S223]
MTVQLSFPPLLSGEQVANDAYGHALRRATEGCDAGLIVYDLAANQIEAAIVFAPEVSLTQAVAMLPLCEVGFQNALGALAPPEVAVQFDWNGSIRINGGLCGSFRAQASTDDVDAVPDWLVVGFTLPLYPVDDPQMVRMGHQPDQTALYAEGCSEVLPPELVEAWARHSLHWINQWDSSGPKGLHEQWRGLIHGIAEATTMGNRSGKFIGIDEHFGMLLRDDTTTHLFPLTSVLEPAP